MPLRAALAITLMNMLAMRASRVLTPLFALELGANPLVIGVLAAMDSVFPLLLAIYAGRLSDRLGSRAPIMAGSLGVTLGLMLPFFVPSLTGLFVSAAFLGLAQVFYNVSLQNLIGTIGKPEERTRNFTNYTLALSVGSLLGPLGAGFAIDVVGHARGYLLASITPLVAFAIMAAQPRVAHVFAAAQDSKKHGSPLELWRIPALRRVFIVGGVLLAGIDLFSFYMPIYGHSVGLSATVIGAVLSMFSLASFIVRLIIPAMSRRWREQAILGYAMMVAAAGFLGIPFVANAWLLGAVSFLVGFALGCGMPLAMSMVYGNCPPGRSGEALGLRVAINNVMHVIVPIAFGGLGSAFGVGPVFWVSAAALSTTGWLGRAAPPSESKEKSHG